MLKVITVTNNIEATQPLIKSLENNGWDYQVIEVSEWRGFGTKLIETYNFLKEHPEVTEFIFCDAFDVLALGTPKEFEEKLDGYTGMIFSAEKGCWPDDSLRNQYESHDHGFNFLNSGAYYSNSDWFINMIEHNMPSYSDDDQLYLTKFYLHASDALLDNKQEFFNSHSFIAEGEYTYRNNRVQVNGQEPIFIHFNGRTIDKEFNEKIKI